MKTKYWAIVLCAVALVLGMVACSQQANQKPQEPAQTAQQTEPVTTTEPAKPPVETGPQEEPKQPEATEPVEVKESDPVDEVVETVPVESTPEPTPVPTETPKQEPATTTPPVNAPAQSVPPAQQGKGGEQLPADGGDSSGELTPEQQKQSIADALSGLTGTGEHVKPGDPGWDDYASEIAGLLQPSN